MVYRFGKCVELGSATSVACILIFSDNTQLVAITPIITTRIGRPAAVGEARIMELARDDVFRGKVAASDHHR